MPISFQRSVAWSIKCLLRISGVSSLHIHFQIFGLSPCLGVEWGGFPRGHSATFFIIQEVRAQPSAGAEADSRCLNGSKYWCEAEGWRFLVNLAYATSCMGLHHCILFIYILSGGGGDSTFGKSKSKCFGRFADLPLTCRRTGRAAGGKGGPGLPVWKGASVVAVGWRPAVWMWDERGLTS